MGHDTARASFKGSFYPNGNALCRLWCREWWLLVSAAISCSVLIRLHTFWNGTLYFFLEFAVLKSSLQTATTSSWHLPAVLSSLIIFIVFHYYADNMHLRYMLFSGGLYSGVKLVELIFKVVMLPIIVSYLELFNNTAKCRNRVLMKRRVSHVCN